MIKKRFTLVEMPYDDFIIKDTLEDKEVYNNGVVDLLNEFANLSNEQEDTIKGKDHLLDMLATANEELQNKLNKIPPKIREVWLK